MRSLTKIFLSFIVLLMCIFAVLYFVSYHLYENKITNEFREKCRMEAEQILELLPLSLIELQPEAFEGKLQDQLNRSSVISIAFFDTEMKLMFAKSKKLTDKKIDPDWMESLEEPRIIDGSLSVSLAILKKTLSDLPAEASGYINIIFSLDDLHKSLKIFKSIFPAAGIAGAVFFILFLLALRYLLIMPIMELSGKTEQVKNGNMTVRARLFFVRELRQLSDTFNSMLATLEKNRELLEKLATTDGLTGLFNRKSFDDAFNTRISESVRYEHKFSLMLIDLDKFKNINDTYGHQAGDIVLKTLADALRSVLRKTDFPARIGGDEFAVILAHTMKDRAIEVAERIIKAVNDSPVETEPDKINFTVTIGISTFPQDGITENDLKKTADARLYAAKSRGRNCIGAE
jgi:diguanylate cyclase (GGDEF)-like protein